MDGWRQYHNRWLGISLDVPPGWQVTPGGAVAVNADPAGLTSAAVRLFQVGTQITPRSLARHVVAGLRAANPSVRAWIVAGADGSPTADATVLRIAATAQGVPVEGTLYVQVTAGVAAVTGYQAPAARLGTEAETLRRILASVRFGGAVPTTPFTDAVEGSYTGYAPADWTVRAGLRRTATAERNPLVDFSAADPTGVATLIIPPHIEQYPMVSPAQATARIYLSQAVLPALGRDYRDCVVEAVTDHPELAQREASRADPSLGVSCDASAVRVAYSAAGAAYREKVVVMVTRIGAVRMCSVAIAGRGRAPAERFEEFDAYFTGIGESITPDPGWAQREQARGAQLLAQAYGRYQQANRDLTDAVRRAGQANVDAAQSLRAGAHRRWNEFQRLQEDHIMPALRGEQVMVNPRTGDRWEVPLRFGAFWADGADRLYQTRPGDNAPVIGADRLEPI